MGTKLKEPKAGRPPLKAKDRHDRLIRVLVTKSEHEELRLAAEVASLSLSMWIRTVALERARG
jgi:hypothetical protein